MDVLKTAPESIKSKIQTPLYVYEAKGCKKCKDKGYAGRAGIFEVLEMTHQLADVVNKGAGEIDIFRQGRAQGMITMVEDGISKILSGVTTVEEIVRVAEQK